MGKSWLLLDCSLYLNFHQISLFLEASLLLTLPISFTIKGAFKGDFLSGINDKLHSCFLLASAYMPTQFALHMHMQNWHNAMREKLGVCACSLAAGSSWSFYGWHGSWRTVWTYSKFPLKKIVTFRVMFAIFLFSYPLLLWDVILVLSFLLHVSSFCWWAKLLDWCSEQMEQ